MFRFRRGDSSYITQWYLLGSFLWLPWMYAAAQVMLFITPVQGVMQVDPFLLLDELGLVNYAPGEAIGAPDHPHRGFETVTYMIDGEFQHADSSGKRGELLPGDVQWMTAGSGVVHAEMPSDRFMREGGRQHGFQIWVNLPKAHKLTHPRYQDVRGSMIPVWTSEDGLASAKIIAGEAQGISGAAQTIIPIGFTHYTLQPGAKISHHVPDGHTAIAYLMSGVARFTGEREYAARAAIVPNVPICATFAAPYLRRTYSMTSYLRSWQRSMSMSGASARLGSRKRSNRRSYWIGQTWLRWSR